MRHLALAALGLGSAFAAASVSAQTYGSAATYYDCRYNSIAQCNMSASGRAAQ